MKTLPVKQPLTQHYTPEEVAASLGVTRRSVYEWLLNGTLKAGRAGRRWVITPAQVEAFIAVRNAPQVRTAPQVAPQDDKPGPGVTTASVALRPGPVKKKARR